VNDCEGLAEARARLVVTGAEIRQRVEIRFD
jgi:hypothetical protein